MSVPMILRRWRAVGVLLALMAPSLVPPEGRLVASGHGTIVAGAACCGPMACCAAAVPCAAGHCERDAHDGATTLAPGLRLAAGCPGPAPATTAADRDPMLPSPVAALPSVTEPRDASLPIAVTAPIRNNAPSVPPPRV